MAASQPESIAKEGASPAARSPAGRVLGMRRLGFALVNLWLVYHLLAIAVGPASVPPTSPLVQSAWRCASGYLQALYLNHGFRFFAPDPSGSTLVDYTLEFADGRTESGRVPDRASWPRLRYHRHFMVTEFLGNGPEEFRPLVERAIARNLCRESGAERVRMEVVFHDTASLPDILSGKGLNEPESFHRIPLGTFSVKELSEPYQPPYQAPSPDERAPLTIPPPSPAAPLEEELLPPPPPSAP
jgi:hypothetical protein